MLVDLRRSILFNITQPLTSTLLKIYIFEQCKHIFSKATEMSINVKSLSSTLILINIPTKNKNHTPKHKIHCALQTHAPHRGSKEEEKKKFSYIDSGSARVRAWTNTRKSCQYVRSRRFYIYLAHNLRNSARTSAERFLIA